MGNLFWISVLLIFYTMVGYPILLILLNKILPHKKIKIDESFSPNVTVIIAAHNEENVIENKIINLLNVDYEKNKYEILVASDFSTDNTNTIVERYSKGFPENIKLVKVAKRQGKTNAQNEAVTKARGDILVFTDANAMFDKNSIKQLVSYLSDSEVAYVCGKLVYNNDDTSIASESESSYWNLDLAQRKIESDLSSITAGNGSIYAVRKDDYISIDPIYSHDSVFPPKYVIYGKRAVFNPNAIAYEKAGESIGDEFSRKVRMSRKIIGINFLDISKYNFVKHPLFTLFYVSHRTFRNNLYLFHMIAYLSNLCLILNQYNFIFIVAFIVQNVSILSGLNIKKIKNKYFRFMAYYVITIFAQFLGAKNEITGKSKPFWQKAESTR
ncbi:glycosyltransferase [Enterococcus gallinarum]|uniref:glycosyltransferase n=1 Tax=Enterococcus gallinarum TaxID=1353 RepID=UPI00214CE2B8|nr:glycosyltransferase [Enterococcus gallinarum]MCR1927177.1 glycosyltransferase [Enterococcus gallinarum]